MGTPVRLLGLPTDKNSSYMRGAAEAPAVVRRLMSSGMSNLVSESGCDLGDEWVFVDAGDLHLPESSVDFETIRDAAAVICAEGSTVFLGGDHSVTWPVLTGRKQAGFDAPHLIQVDAHPDLYPEFDNNEYSHASPMARIMERGLAASLTQVGLRTVNAVQAAAIEKYAVNAYPAGRPLPGPSELPHGATWFSIDLDGLDPAFAPGVSHHEPGGLSVRDVIALIWSAPGPVVGGDIVELNPNRDINDVTAAVTFKLVKELVARIAAD